MSHIRLQNIHTGEVWIQTFTQECKYRFLHPSDIFFDLEFDGSLSIWWFPGRAQEYSCAGDTPCHLIDDIPIKHGTYNIKFYVGMDLITQEQFFAIEKTIDIRNSTIVNSNPHFERFL